MRSVIACALLMAMASTGALLLATLWSSRAQAWWDDSHGYRGVRAYGCGPARGGHYFSGVTVRVHCTEIISPVCGKYCLQSTGLARSPDVADFATCAGAVIGPPADGSCRLLATVKGRTRSTTWPLLASRNRTARS